MVSLLSLPPEILTLVAGQLSSKSDLSKLSKTCKILKAIVFPILYSHLVLKVPRTWMRLSCLENLLKSTSEGLQQVTSLRITTAPSHHLENDEEAFLEENTVSKIRGGVCDPDVLLDTHLNALVRILLGRLSSRRLTEFIWDHPSPMNHATFSNLADAHIVGLTALELNQLSRDGMKFRLAPTPALSKFAFDCIDVFVDWKWVSDILLKSSNSLRHLSLGAEFGAVWDYQDSDDAFYGALDDILEKMVHYLEEPAGAAKRMHLVNSHLLSLDTLVLKGLNASKLIKADFLFQDWTCLRTLVLESCPGLEQALAFLADTENVDGQPLRSDLRLSTLRVRCEGPSLVAQLHHFLASITGLVNLSVLLESRDRFRHLNLKTVLKSHGNSLKTLVLEERTGRRENFRGPTRQRLHTPRQLETIAKRCPNLVELGLPMCWKAITASWARQEYIRRAFSSLCHLRTLNIRNAPSFAPTTTELSMEDMQAAYVQSALRTIFGRPPGTTLSERSEVLGLRTLAIGSLTYQDIHDPGHEHKDDVALQLFLRPRIYRIDTWSLPDGERRTFATLTETGKYDVTDATVGNVEVLKPYWLG